MFDKDEIREQFADVLALLPEAMREGVVQRIFDLSNASHSAGYDLRAWED